jgi:hypothetical protein
MAISSEKVFDLLPSVCEIYEKLDVEKFAKGLKKGITQKEAGVKVILYIFKNSGKIKEEIFNIVAILQDITVEEAKALGIIQNITVIKELFTDEDTMSFFKQAMQ